MVLALVYVMQDTLEHMEIRVQLALLVNIKWIRLPLKEEHVLIAIQGLTKHWQEVQLVSLAQRTRSRRRAVPLSHSAYVTPDTIALMEGRVVSAHGLPQN